MARSTGLPVDDVRLIRPALVHAVAVARAGMAADPPEQPPDGLRKVLRFRRLQTAALETVRRVLDADEDFRSRVIGEVNEDELGRHSWVWLTRPEGWLEELTTLTAAGGTADAEEASIDERDVARLRRALTGAEDAARRHEATAKRAQDADRRLRTELGEARTSRREADRAAAAARREAERSKGERDAALRRAQTFASDLGRVRAELDVVRTALHEAESELALERTVLRSHTGRSDDTARVAGRGGRADPELATAAAPVPADRPEDVRGLADRIDAAVATAAALSDALVEMAGDLSALGAGAQESMRARRDPQPPDATPGGRHGRARTPAAMPPGVWDDTPEAAAHLVRLRGAVVLVDGYNVARTAWLGLTPEEERRRLIAALEELHARTAAEITVVFDGVQEGGPWPGHGSRTVRVRFTAEGVSADDVVTELVDRFPVQQPVVVVSSDREVADGARARGANTVSSRQFLTALGR